jgi:hypothetical protein
MKSKSRRQLAQVAGLLVGALLVYGLVFHTPPGPRSLRHFDPERTAELEVGMWQAYYRKEKLRLFRLLVTMLHEQYRYPWAKATLAGFHLARAAAGFGDARSGYERALPDLERAYAISRDWTGAGYDPRAVARAELAWWVARREPGRNSAESVGALIAEEYALLYEVPRERVAQAGLLRAQAAVVRDQGGANADWPEVSRLLRESYRSLREAVSAP